MNQATELDVVSAVREAEALLAKGEEATPASITTNFRGIE